MNEITMIKSDRISFAPMLDVTNTYQRYMMRQLTRHVTLYSEMFVAETLIHSRYTDDIIDFDECEHPIVGQLGGFDPCHMATGARILADKGYDEININCGCPSDNRKRFGAQLMLEPERVREIVEAIKEKVNIPVTVKCRIGVDDHDSYDDLTDFISVVSGCKCTHVSVSDDSMVASSGENVLQPTETMGSSPLVEHFIVHARKCWTHGVNTRDNRRIPPLQYDWVFRLLDDFPQLSFTLNGGLRSFSDMNDMLERESHRKLRGIMIGRMISQHPWLFRHTDEFFYGVRGPHLSRRDIVNNFVDYVERIEKNHENWKPNSIDKSKPITTLFCGALRGGSVFRTVLTKKLYEQKLPFRQAVMESLRCFDDSILDVIDDADLSQIDEYRIDQV